MSDIIDWLKNNGLSVLATAASGGGGAVAAKIASDLILSATGSASTADALKTLQSDPDSALKLRQAEMTHQAELVKLWVDDVKSARELQAVALQSDDPWSQRFVYFLAGFVLLASFAYIGAVTFLDIPASGQRVADTILGVVIGTCIQGVIGYFFGASRQTEKPVVRK